MTVGASMTKSGGKSRIRPPPPCHCGRDRRGVPPSTPRWRGGRCLLFFQSANLNIQLPLLLRRGEGGWGDEVGKKALPINHFIPPNYLLIQYFPRISYLKSRIWCIFNACNASQISHRRRFTYKKHPSSLWASKRVRRRHSGCE